MPHTIIYNSESHVIEMTVQGELTMKEAKEITLEASKIAKEQNCFVYFSDYREATVKLSTLEVYELPKIISDILASSGLNVHKFKRAFVVARDLKVYEFFENVTVNRGQNVRVFYDVDEAKRWLLGK